MDRPDPAAWLSRFLQSRSLDRPDSDRPLYAYRCSENEFAELSEVLRGGTHPPMGVLQPSPSLPPATTGRIRDASSEVNQAASDASVVDTHQTLFLPLVDFGLGVLP